MKPYCNNVYVALLAFSIGSLLGSTVFTSMYCPATATLTFPAASTTSSCDCTSSGGGGGGGGASASRTTSATISSSRGPSVWETVPLQHSEHTEFMPGVVTDAFNPIYSYMRELSLDKKPEAVDFPELPQFHSWPHYFEAYHNHFYRFRGKSVVFMEVGVQSGGKIPLLRDYFGPGFRYVGIDINPGTKRFEGVDWVSIEIGDSTSPEFWSTMRTKYPHVDVFLDDGGHTMKQQMLTLEEMLPHVQPEGLYICEDLGTSWSDERGPKTNFGGMPGGTVGNRTFLDSTTVGLVHKTMDWFQASWITGGGATQPTLLSDVPDDLFPETWWKKIPEQVKHIHYYNQIVVYGT